MFDTPAHNNTVTQNLLGSALRSSPERFKMFYLCPVITPKTLPVKPEHISAYELLLDDWVTGNWVEPFQKDCKSPAIYKSLQIMERIEDGFYFCCLQIHNFNESQRVQAVADAVFRRYAVGESI